MNSAAPKVDKLSLNKLPDTELRRFMIEKDSPHVELPGGHDFDAAPAIPLITSDYVREIRRFRYAGRDERGLPKLKKAASGNIWRVTQASPDMATQAWWQAMTNTASWGNSPRPRSRPFMSDPVSIPGKIEAEAFDDGGPDLSYADMDRKIWSQIKERNITAFRVLEAVDFEDADDDEGGYAVARTEAGEWMDYTVKVMQDGEYRISARIATMESDGVLRIQFDGEEAIKGASVPPTGGPQSWKTIEIGRVTLTSGIHRMRICVDKGGFDLNWLDFSAM